MKKLIKFFTLILLLFASCKSEKINTSGKERAIFSEDFQTLDPRWKRGEGENGEGEWKVEKGFLHIENAKNDPFWLDFELPDFFRITFDVVSNSPSGDIKFELLGDGQHHASGYVFIFGGWNNSLDVIARLNEHGKDRKSQPCPGVKMGKTYHFSVSRLPTPDSEGVTLRWEVDGELKMEYVDKKPLVGREHRYFAFSNWTSKLSFSKLRIYPLK